MVVSAPLWHYTIPVPSELIRSRRLTADAHGSFRTTLTAPPGRGWSYQARVVFADGTAEASHSAGRSFDELVVGSAGVCRTLNRPHR